jgi:hypothetical protein
MVNTATTAIYSKSIQKLIELSGHTAQILDFSTIVAAPTDAPKATSKTEGVKPQKPNEKK